MNFTNVIGKINKNKKRSQEEKKKKKSKTRPSAKALAKKFGNLSENKPHPKFSAIYPRI